MKLNRNELKKILYDFNSISNRLVRANVDDYVGILRKFIANIDSCPVILDYIEQCGKPTFNIESASNQLAQIYGGKFTNLGDTEREECTNIYHILTYIAGQNLAVYEGIAQGYACSNRSQDKGKGFNERVVMILIRHIEGYLTKIGLDMGLDENIQYNITVTNGQANIATDNAIINATNTTGIDISHLLSLINSINSQHISELSKDDQDVFNDSIETIKAEMQQQAPKKGLIKTAIRGLSAINSSAELTASVQQIIQFVAPFIQ